MSPSDRAEARRMRWAGLMTHPAIAKAFGVHRTTVERLCADLPISCDPRSRAATARRRRAERDARATLRDRGRRAAERHEAVHG